MGRAPERLGCELVPGRGIVLVLLSDPCCGLWGPRAVLLCPVCPLTDSWKEMGIGHHSFQNCKEAGSATVVFKLGLGWGFCGGVGGGGQSAGHIPQCDLVPSLLSLAVSRSGFLVRFHS